MLPASEPLRRSSTARNGACPYLIVPAYPTSVGNASVVLEDAVLDELVVVLDVVVEALAAEVAVLLLLEACRG